MKLMGHSSGVVGVACVMALFSTAQADTIYVDDDNCPGPGDGSELDPYCSIQTAIDNAVDTDEIVVAPGTYFETVNLLGKAITLHSSDGAEVTTIDAQGTDTVVTCMSGEGPGTVLDGFTLTGGTGSGPFGNGGGMYNVGSSPTVTNCTFSGNSVSNRGGGMSNEQGSSPTVTNCTFIGNSAGGFGGGMYNTCVSHPTVTNCRFSGNSVGQGGGGILNFEGSSPTVTNCTISGNMAKGGGAMQNFFASNPTVTNCIIWNNSPVQIIDFGTSTTVLYSDVQGGWSGAGSNNIDADPMFVSNCCTFHSGPGCDDVDCTVAVCTAEPLCCQISGWQDVCVDLAADLCAICPNDLPLSPGSPCIDAGDNTAVPVDITTDLDGKPRFVDDLGTIDTGNGDPPIVDMGAYEFQGALPCPWDCDGGESTDGTVGIVDFLTLLAQWGGPGSCDFDGGGVGINDFL